MGQDPKDGRTIAIKPTQAMRAAVEEISDKERINKSELVRRSIELYKDLYGKLGGDWHEAERRSGVTGQSMGSVLAGLVKSALEQERKTKK